MFVAQILARGPRARRSLRLPSALRPDPREGVRLRAAPPYASVVPPLATPRLCRWHANVALSALLVGAFALAAQSALSDPQASPLEMADLCAYLAVTAVLVVNVWRRPDALSEDTSPTAWIVSLSSYAYYLFFDAGDAPAWIVPLHLVADTSLIYLGTSFSVLPARRDVKSGWLYRFVRHPAYAAYMLADVTFCIAVPSVRNVAVALCGGALLVVRAHLEERVLGEDPTYREYQRATRYRFFPGAY